MAQGISIAQRADAPDDLWVGVMNDAEEWVDPTGLVASLGFRYQVAWTEFAGEIVEYGGVPLIHLTIPAAFKANLTNREFSVRVTLDGIVYQVWSYRLAF